MLWLLDHQTVSPASLAKRFSLVARSRFAINRDLELTCAWWFLASQVRSVLEMLVDALTIPSESVQRAVSACLIPLMPYVSADKEYVDGVIKNLLHMLTKVQGS